ncbi:MAG: electron transfer flavoprotein subunit beta/FixA family protein [Gemmatimonadota bacterium]|nr:electron transfer flavoprotein subunit beta/FixA family protein [Gemmatimonadota bacterium]MDE2676869.1 electron transfer flavoprotein subunit beta/FixA family protein [Gemmatimonadota bacterium]
MNITVCVKRVPDTETRIRISPGGADIERDGVKYVPSPYDEFAVEAALQLVEAAGGQSPAGAGSLAGGAGAGTGTGQVTLLSFGPEAAKESLRAGLALGAHRAVLLKGEPGMDGWATARVLAAELEGDAADLVLFGVKAVDDDQQQVGPMVAELLGRPCATSVAAIDVDGGVATCRRAVEGGHEVVELDLPAVLTITKGRYEPRYASLRGIMMAKRKPLVEKEAPSIEAGLVVERLDLPPARPGGRIVGEGPNAVPELVRLLREEAKVL